MSRRRYWRELRRDPVTVVAFGVILTLLGLAVFYPTAIGANAYDAGRAHLLDRLQSPSWLGGRGGLLGTDSIGRGLFLRIVFGLRTSFLVAFIATCVAALIGATVGITSGYLGGKSDSIMMRFTDVYLAMPGLLLIMTVVRVAGSGKWTLALLLALVTWPVFARVMRGPVLSMRSSDLVLASQGFGASARHVLLKHVVPNTLVPLVALSAIEFSRLLLAEAALSFLGFGIQSPDVSLGLILSEGRDYLETAWWISTFAGLFLAAMALSISLIGTWLRQVMDPAGSRDRRG